MPDDLVDLGVVRRAVQLACRAPSLHNSQPWHWVVDRKGLHLHLDRGRILAATDRSGREAIISCGAVLDHLRVAMAAAGWASHIERFPEPGEPDRLASVRFRRLDDARAAASAEAQRRRADAILLRRTDRRPLEAPRDPAGFRRLAASAIAETAETPEIGETPETAAVAVQLDVVAAQDRPRLAEASRLTAAQRAEDSSYHIELGWWTAGYDFSEGIPPASLAAAAEQVEVGRAFPTGPGQRSAPPARDRSMILVLSTAEDTPQAALRCGEALSAVLLEATLTGLGSCPLTHITEVPDSRQIVAELIDRTAVPQVLIRIGRVPPLRESPASTPRRSLEDVLEVRA